eukprot:544618-Rhodomonas_salina.4
MSRRTWIHCQPCPVQLIRHRQPNTLCGALTRRWQSPKPSGHEVVYGHFIPNAADIQAQRIPGFGVQIMLINGGLECGWAAWGENLVKVTTRFCDDVGDLGDALGGCAVLTSVGCAGLGQARNRRLYYEAFSAHFGVDPGERDARGTADACLAVCFERGADTGSVGRRSEPGMHRDDLVFWRELRVRRAVLGPRLGRSLSRIDCAMSGTDPRSAGWLVRWGCVWVSARG